ncbi:MAG TPA: response regulator [Caulobacterales bacterium]|nr:response regulator [Caulobacterales bacterium]
MLNILTVDDSRVMRQMLMLTLRGAGHEVYQASDGQEGLEALNEDVAFDLIITDINMPRLDGFGFIARARELARYRGTPILVLSTESSAEKKARARAAGASGWIVKPFNAEALLNAVRRVTG